MQKNLTSRSIVSLLLSLLLASACSTPSKPTKESNRRAFLNLLSEQPEQVWSPQVSKKVKDALHAYQSHFRIDGKTEYGASVRTFDLKNKKAADIDTALQQSRCEKRNDVLKNPKTHAPILDSDGHTVPLLVYLCPDGGVVRIKPQGDPTSKFRPQPHGSKALRFPYYSKFENFDDEIVKVDNQGNAIPKWAKDLNQLYSDKEKQDNLIDGWAEDAHTDLPASP